MERKRVRTEFVECNSKDSLVPLPATGNGYFAGSSIIPMMLECCFSGNVATRSSLVIWRGGIELEDAWA